MDIKDLKEKLEQRLHKIKGNDPVSRSRRASIKARILELEAQAAEEADRLQEEEGDG